MVTPERIRTASVKALTELRMIVLAVNDMLVFVRRFPLLRKSVADVLGARGFPK